MRAFHIRLIGLLSVLALAAVGAYAALPAPGVRHVDIPKLKRGYTVCVPAGLEEKKSYMAVVWLHPLDDDMSARIRADWWADLDRRKIFLVIPESTNPKKWTDADLPYLLGLLADLPAQFPIDRRKIVLFGAEAGGQTAFSLARKYSAQLFSLVAMSAYPVNNAKDPIVSLPPDPAKKNLSILMIISSTDHGRHLCRQAADLLQARGFASGLVELPDAPQPYLPQAKPQVLAWLDKLSTGERPSVAVPESERAAQQALADAAKRLFAEILKPADEAEPKGAQLWKLRFAGLELKMPPGWKVLLEAPGSARFTTAVPPEGPLLVQLTVEKDPKGLDHAVKQYEAFNRTRGMRYTPVETSALKMTGREWIMQQATCLAYQDRPGKDGKPVVVDAPSMLTACYWAPDPKSPAYIRVVFVFTEATAAKVDVPALVNQVLSTVRILPKKTDEKPVIE